MNLRSANTPLLSTTSQLRTSWTLLQFSLATRNPRKRWISRHFSACRRLLNSTRPSTMGSVPSITVDRVSGWRLGLHLDSWDGLDVSSRWKSRNRVVVNRGPGERYLYIVPVPIEEMAERVESSERLHPGEVADTYIRNTRRTPCLRMLQPANVAYVCCTERLVHDACVSPGRRSSGKPPLPGSLCQERHKQTGYPVIHIEVAGHITIRKW